MVGLEKRGRCRINLFYSIKISFSYKVLFLQYSVRFALAMYERRMTDMPNRRENRNFRSLGLEVVGIIKDVPIDNMKRSSVPNNGSLSAVTFDQSFQAYIGRLASIQ